MTISAKSSPVKPDLSVPVLTDAEKFRTRDIQFRLMRSSLAFQQLEEEFKVWISQLVTAHQIDVTKWQLNLDTLQIQPFDAASKPTV